MKRWTVSFRKYGKTKAGVKHANRDGAKLAFASSGEQLALCEALENPFYPIISILMAVHALSASFCMQAFLII